MKQQDFPIGTRFFIKGFDVPVIVQPGGRASSWFGGSPSEWTDEDLKFAMFESNEGLDSVTFAEWLQAVEESKVEV